MSISVLVAWQKSITFNDGARQGFVLPTYIVGTISRVNSTSNSSLILFNKSTLSKSGAIVLCIWFSVSTSYCSHRPISHEAKSYSVPLRRLSPILQNFSGCKPSRAYIISGSKTPVILKYV